MDVVSREDKKLNNYRFAAVLAGIGVALGSTGAAGAVAVPNAPSHSYITRIAHSYYEAGVTGETYAPDLATEVETAAGGGSTVVAVAATRSPSADGTGQLVLFFYDGRYIGLNSSFEAASIRKIRAAGTGAFAVTYANYKRSDPMYDPSLPPVTIIYHVHAHSVTASAPLPATVHDFESRAERRVAASRKTIAKTAASFHESGVKGETYRPLWNIVKTTEGAGGNVITAVPAVRWPTADGHGQIILFFNGNHFVGLNSSFEALEITKMVSTAPGAFAVTYANYKPTDAMVDPTLPPVTITYRVSSDGIEASAALPKGVKDRLKAVR